MYEGLETVNIFADFDIGIYFFRFCFRFLKA